jgi:hypothetical protein
MRTRRAASPPSLLLLAMLLSAAWMQVGPCHGSGHSGAASACAPPHCGSDSGLRGTVGEAPLAAAAVGTSPHLSSPLGLAPHPHLTQPALAQEQEQPAMSGAAAAPLPAAAAAATPPAAPDAAAMAAANATAANAMANATATANATANATAAANASAPTNEFGAPLLSGADAPRPTGTVTLPGQTPQDIELAAAHAAGWPVQSAPMTETERAQATARILVKNATVRLGGVGSCDREPVLAWAGHARGPRGLGSEWKQACAGCILLLRPNRPAARRPPPAGNRDGRRGPPRGRRRQRRCRGRGRAGGARRRSLSAAAAGRAGGQPRAP